MARLVKHPTGPQVYSHEAERREASIRHFQLHVSENLTRSNLNNKWNLLAHITEKSEGEIRIQA